MRIRALRFLNFHASRVNTTTRAGSDNRASAMLVFFEMHSFPVRARINSDAVASCQTVDRYKYLSVLQREPGLRATRGDASDAGCDVRRWLLYVVSIADRLGDAAGG